VTDPGALFGQGAPLTVTAAFTAKVAVPVKPQRTWQRKWRDVQHELKMLTDIYAGNHVDQDGFTRQIESFFKTCRELADWIEESVHLPAIAYVNSPQSALELCDAVAQTAKHHTRRPNPGRDPITAVVVSLYGDEKGVHADVEWQRQSGAGVADSLELARRCMDEWRQFFQQHGLNPN
jgi:hypothetical protein